MGLLQEIAALGAGIVRGEWLGLDPHRRPLVQWSGGPQEPEVAELAAGAIPAGMVEDSAGVPALILPPGKPGERPVLLAILRESVPETFTPDRLVLEAKKQLVIRCGNGRLELDGDGSVQLRARTILSRSSGVHRIKGGAVQIN
jgi:hypothetical protein